MSENITQVEDKNDSPNVAMRHSEKATNLILELNKIHVNAKETIIELITTLRDVDKLNDKQIKKVLFTEVHLFDRATIYRALPEDMKRTYTKPKLEYKSEPELIQEEPLTQPIIYGNEEYVKPKVTNDTFIPQEPEYRTVIANLTIETEEANLDLPVTVRIYDNGKIELEKFTCNQLMLK